MEGLLDIVLGYASWFVVSLGVAQVAFAILLAKCKRLWVFAIFMLSCATIGLFIQSNTQQTLPFQIEKALIVVLFLGLGIFYRIYEPGTEKYFRPLYLLIELINNSASSTKTCRDAFLRLSKQDCRIKSPVAKTWQLAETQECVSTVWQ